jgi:hypothetical protein
MDDSAFRKGLAYGTMSMDADSGTAVELLDGRDVKPLEA